MIELDLPVVQRLGGAAQAELEIGRVQAAVAAGERKLPGEEFALLGVDAPTDRVPRGDRARAPADRRRVAPGHRPEPDPPPARAPGRCAN